MLFQIFIASIASNPGHNHNRFTMIRQMEVVSLGIMEFNHFLQYL